VSADVSSDQPIFLRDLAKTEGGAWDLGFCPNLLPCVSGHFVNTSIVNPLGGQNIMSFRVNTLIAAGLFGTLLLVGSLAPVHAGGEGCTKDKAKDQMGTSTLWTPDASSKARQL
jgi:hypothetical protein